MGVTGSGTGYISGVCVPTGAPGRSSLPPSPELGRGAAVRCQLTHSVACAHHKPITALKAAAGRLVTGSQDHTLRVRAQGHGEGAVPWVLVTCLHVPLDELEGQSPGSP